MCLHQQFFGLGRPCQKQKIKLFRLQRNVGLRTHKAGVACSMVKAFFLVSTTLYNKCNVFSL